MQLVVGPVQNPNIQINRDGLHALDIGVQGSASTCTANSNAHDNKAVTMKEHNENSGYVSADELSCSSKGNPHNCPRT